MSKTDDIIKLLEAEPWKREFAELLLDLLVKHCSAAADRIRAERDKGGLGPFELAYVEGVVDTWESIVTSARNIRQAIDQPHD